jgi:hypothetical protein
MKAAQVIMNTGTHAAALAAKCARVDVIPGYPITPQTSIMEAIAAMVESGEMNARFIPVEGEHSVLAAAVAASAAGARVFTATSANGLLYMHEVLHMASGGRLPVVMCNVNRGIFAPWTLWADHQDSFSQRDTGWIQYHCSSNQEVFNTILQAFRVDKIFTRVGASDDLAAGQSTFMVEMVEVSNILHNASKNSLIILDEIGRGTSTYDGMSIARAVSEYILEGIKARTMFATHYHELTDLSDKYSQVVNLSVSVYESEETVVFLKKVLPGKADKSYGIQVAKLAGLPQPVIERAREILLSLEKSPVMPAAPVLSQPSLFAPQHPILSELEEMDLNGITPLEAINLLFKWKHILS